MRHILTSLVLGVLLFPSLALGETVKWDDLVERESLHYKKFTDVPFTGKVTGTGQGKLENGERVGPWVNYHNNGQLYYKGTYKNGKRDGPWVRYHDNGQLYYKGTYKNDKRDGPWVRYHDNGQLSSKRTYKNGKKDGLWVRYTKDGTVDEEYTGTYKDGVRISD